MPLSVGDKLGHYEVISLLGNGGMGEVYRARDTTLKRDVALKVLPATFLSDPDRMARFQREAQVLASLDHPNIGPIYGIADSADSRGLVLALIEGPTLADRIAAGALPPEEAFHVAKQIIEALEYAHDRGVIHRDLKPANVKITPEGVVKVLDFGLAKVLEDEPPASSLTNSPTLTVGHTRAGVILGTAAYMSPEQAVGRPVDRRSDIFSFGAVLYEMLTGQRAFTGATTPDVLEAVVKNDPDWSKLPAGVSGTVRQLLRRCLVKDRKQRLQAIGEARIILENPGSEAEASRGLKPALPWSWIAAAVLGVTTAVALWAPWRSQKPVDRPLVRLDVDLGSDVALYPVNVPNPTLTVAISPDGMRLVYLASVSGGPPRLFTRRLDQPKATELPGTAGAVGPFFSPDGNWVGFSVGDKLSKVSVDGGSVVPLADGPPTLSASWGEDGNIILGRLGSGLQRIPSGGGSPADVLPLASGELFHVVQQILPGGKAVLFIAATKLDPSGYHVDVVTLADGRRKTIVQGTGALYLPTSNGSGHLVYTNNGTLFGVPFDLERLETRGTAVPILDDVAYTTVSGTAQFDVSRSGTLVYRRGGGASASGTMTLQWVDANGRKEPLRARLGDYSAPSISPDGKQIAMVIRGSSSDVWVYDTQRDAMRRLTFGGGPYTHPVWSPDGKYVFAGSVGNGAVWTRSDGAGQPQPLTQAKLVHVPWSLTPDGKRLGYLDPSLGAPQLWTVPLEETGGQIKAGKPEQFLKSQFQDVGPAFSPDGKWLAYSSNATGSGEVYVRAFPPPASGQGGQWQVSNSRGFSPVWSRNGHDLLYQSGDQIMAVSYTVKGDTFEAGKPRVWLAKLGGTEWDLAPDGKRVVVLTPVDTPEAPKLDHEVVFVFNFFDELRRRAPAGK
ncbi:MAG: serine/threonine-protein kinase [Acidobacteriia bacterium]|nr:serine/threonine-protein kinase [Terriglobia bacterium]